MERLYQALRNPVASAWAPGAHLWVGVRRAAAYLFPFLFPPQEARRYAPAYREGGDYLFLSRAHSAHALWTREIITLAAWGAAVLAVLFVGVVWVWGVSVGAVMVGAIALLYFGYFSFKVWVIVRGRGHPPLAVPQERVRALRDEELPVYTVIVPLLREAEVAAQIVRALSSLDYPPEKLDLIVTLEEYDTETLAALRRAGMPPHWRVLILPDTLPKSKPKSLNVAFLEARGEYVVIYDAEIIPDPDQLKKACCAFAAHPEIAVLQTRLDHYNAGQNALTALFNAEFAFHYDVFLPGLETLRFPVPLSGHSVHFRTDALRRAGGWDPYNVAEDCDMGIRLFRIGARMCVLDSFSREEAASDVGGWLRQRTRWMKGFIQTSAVHLRYPLLLKRDLGSWRNVAAFIALVPGTVLLNLLNIITLILLVAWFATSSSYIQSLYSLPVLYLSNVVALAGLFFFTYLNLVALFRRGRPHLLRYFPLTPFYWLLLAAATGRASWQSMRKKHLHVWEKTTHGTHLVQGKHKHHER